MPLGGSDRVKPCLVIALDMWISDLCISCIYYVYCKSIIIIEKQSPSISYILLY